MDLEPSEEQELLRATARDVLGRLSPIARARAVMAGDAAQAAELWDELARLGWMGLALPEALGGAGQGAVELAGVVEELGRVLAPVPFLATAIVAGAIAQLGDAPQRERWLPRFAAGGLRSALALTEATGRDDPGALALRASAVRGGFELSGEKLFVPDAADADPIAVVARTRGTGARGLGLFLVSRGAPGVDLVPMRSLDPLRPLHRLRLGGVRVAADALLGGDPDAWPRIERALDLGRVLVCAEMVGGAQRCLDDAVHHASERVQFGRPIGANQAIQHQCADVLLRVECARSITQLAATAAACDAPAAAIAVAMAKSSVGEAYRHAAERSLQIHGGLGYTWDSDCHLHLKRALGDEAWLGDGPWHRERIARMLEA